MVTGDNLLTAMSVARECGIIRPNKRSFLIEHRPGELDSRGRTRIVMKQVCPIPLITFWLACLVRLVPCFSLFLHLATYWTRRRLFRSRRAKSSSESSSRAAIISRFQVSCTPLFRSPGHDDDDVEFQPDLCIASSNPLCRTNIRRPRPRISRSTFFSGLCVRCVRPNGSRSEAAVGQRPSGSWLHCGDVRRWRE